VPLPGIAVAIAVAVTVPQPLDGVGIAERDIYVCISKMVYKTCVVIYLSETT
jgi:hypothetical protein